MTESGGPIERHLRSQLPSPDLSIAVAPRSPVGPGAFRISWSEVENDAARKAAALAAWLEIQAWAERAVARPPNVYLRLRTCALRDWLVADGARLTREPASGRAEGVRVKLLSFGGANDGDLRSARLEATARSVSALLEWHGFQVESELSRDSQPHWEGEPTRRLMVEGLEPPWMKAAGMTPSGELPVSGVEVGYGPLRARHGGSLREDDVIEDLARRGPWQRLTNPRRVQTWARAALHFALLRSERTRHVRLNDATLAAELHTLAEAFAALEAGEPVGGAASADEESLRDLVLLLERLEHAAERARDALEPALLARHVKGLALAAAASTPALPRTDRLLPVLRAGIGQGLELLGLGEVLESHSGVGDTTRNEERGR